MLKNKVLYLFHREILAMLLLDVILLPLALYTSVWLRLGTYWDHKLDLYMWIFYCLPLWTIPILIHLGLYRAMIRFFDEKIVYIVLIGVSLSVLILAMIIYFWSILAFPRSAIIIYWCIATVYIGGSRLILRGILKRFGYSDTQSKNVGIYGAGDAGVQLANYLTHNKDYQLLFFIDDDETKWTKTIRGRKVYPAEKLRELKDKYNIDEVLLAIPSAPVKRRQQIIRDLEENEIYIKTIPALDKIISGKVKFSNIEEVKIEDLLGRLPISPSSSLLAKNISTLNVMVTGAGGSIGSELCRQIAALKPNLLVLFDASEYALYTIEQELTNKFGYLSIKAILGSVIDAELVIETLEQNDIDTIYHAAAYKHVPIVENCPLSGINNNAIGTYIVANAARVTQVSNMVLISTDKAVRPTNVMGASKRFAELVMQAFAAESSQTVYSMVRFGNVLGSSGSVVPLFKQQISLGGPITVTHPDIIRYFMTIPEAVYLVIQAGSMAQGGEVFVLDMGEPVKIVDLAKQMVYLSGLTLKDENHIDGDIEIKYTGLRAGEKLYEELLIGNNPDRTSHPQIMKANEEYIKMPELCEFIQQMQLLMPQRKTKLALELLKKIVPESTIKIHA